MEKLLEDVEKIADRWMAEGDAGSDNVEAREGHKYIGKKRALE